MKNSVNRHSEVVVSKVLALRSGAIHSNLRITFEHGCTTEMASRLRLLDLCGRKMNCC